MTLAVALKMLLETVEVRLVAVPRAGGDDRGEIAITTRRAAAADPAVTTRIYNVRDLLAPPAGAAPETAALARLVDAPAPDDAPAAVPDGDANGPDAHGDPGPGVAGVNGLLAVRRTAAGHRRVAGLLHDLRAAHAALGWEDAAGTAP